MCLYSGLHMGLYSGLNRGLYRGLHMINTGVFTNRNQPPNTGHLRTGIDWEWGRPPAWGTRFVDTRRR